MPDYPDGQKQVGWEFPADPSSYIASSGKVDVGAAAIQLYGWAPANTGLYVIQRLQVRGTIYDGDTVASREPAVYVTMLRGLDAKSAAFNIDGATFKFNIVASGLLVSDLISIGTQNTPLLVRGSDGTTGNTLQLNLNQDNSTQVFFSGYYSLLMWSIT